MKRVSMRRQLETLERLSAPAADHQRITIYIGHWDGANGWPEFLRSPGAGCSTPEALTASDRNRLREIVSDDSLDIDGRRTAALVLEHFCGETPAIVIDRDQVLLVEFRKDWNGNDAHELAAKREDDERPSTDL